MTIHSVIIDATGCVVPSYPEYLQGVQDAMRSVYGSDIVLTPDSQDGEWTAIFAQALYDLGQTVLAAYNNFRPDAAQGAGLSSLVNINGIARQASSNSTVNVTLTGVAGTVVTNGTVNDTSGNVWNLPPSVTIGLGGTVIATATAKELGAISAAVGTVTKIGTPTRGWQSVTNAGAAVPGAPVEPDAQLRVRRAQAVSLPAETVLEAISAAVGNVPGVSRYFVYQNDTDTTDADGIPAHSICAVVQGGDAMAIAKAIASRKAPGIQTFGTTTQTVVDSRGVPNDIHFYTLTDVPLHVEVDITSLPGYVSPTGAQIQQAIVDFVNGLAIGEDSFLTRLYSPANLGGVGPGATFHVTAIRQSRAGSPTASDVAIAFNEAASCVVGSVALNVS